VHPASTEPSAENMESPEEVVKTITSDDSAETCQPQSEIESVEIQMVKTSEPLVDIIQIQREIIEIQPEILEIRTVVPESQPETVEEHHQTTSTTSWASIVGTQTTSDTQEISDATPSETRPSRTPHRPIVTVTVDETEPHAPTVHVDDEGFVEIVSKRSRSRSRSFSSQSPTRNRRRCFTTSSCIRISVPRRIKSSRVDSAARSELSATTNACSTSRRRRCTRS